MSLEGSQNTFSLLLPPCLASAFPTFVDCLASLLLPIPLPAFPSFRSSSLDSLGQHPRRMRCTAYSVVPNHGATKPYFQICSAASRTSRYHLHAWFAAVKHIQRDLNSKKRRRGQAKLNLSPDGAKLLSIGLRPFIYAKAELNLPPGVVFPLPAIVPDATPLGACFLPCDPTDPAKILPFTDGRFDASGWLSGAVVLA